MTSIQPDIQATGTLPIVVVIDERARHRVEPIAAPNVIPAWVQLLATVIAFAAGAYGFRTATAAAEPLLLAAGIGIIVAAVGIVAATFAPDIDAAIRARIAAREDAL